MNRLAAAVVALAVCGCSSSSAAPSPRDASVHDARSVDARAEATDDAGSHERDSGAPDSGKDSGHDAGSDGTLGAALCGDCVANKCMPSGRNCENDATCTMWLTCASACLSNAAPSDACLASCDHTYTDAGALFSAVYACICAGCDTLCAAVRPCAAGGDGGP